MLLSILQQTPLRIWMILVALIVFGLSFTRPQMMSRTRIVGVALALALLSLYGVHTKFSAGPGWPFALAGWAIAFLALFGLARRALTPRGAAWSAADGKLRVPGSGLPLLLMLGLFVLNYIAAAGLALQPALNSDIRFASACGLALGAFSGLFAARAAALHTLTRRGSPVPTA